MGRGVRARRPDHRWGRQRDRRRGEAARRRWPAPPDGVRPLVRPRRVPGSGRHLGLRGGAIVRQHLLTFAILFPLVGATLIAVVGRRIDDRDTRILALLTTLATFGVSLLVLRDFQIGTAGYQGYQMVDRASWVRSLGLQYLVGVDGISLWLMLLTTFLFPISVLASWKIETNVARYMVAILVLESAVLGSFLALDLLLFFLFFEAILVPMYLIIGGWGSGNRVYAAIKFFLFTMAGSAFLLVAILFLYSRSGQLGPPSFELGRLTQVAAGLPVSTAHWLFLAFFVAFAVKVPLFPLNTWLPDAHTEAPSAGSVLLAGVLLKVGTYGLLRFNLSMFPQASTYFASFVSVRNRR
ncbi:MAG: NADH-quinone oxidoreductase subunit M [Actinobacteria bacterium]|nr:MAG: NADH-quinone oxidoreductase subunit M [Actinomycetota bacterium]